MSPSSQQPLTVYKTLGRGGTLRAPPPSNLQLSIKPWGEASLHEPLPSREPKNECAQSCASLLWAITEADSLGEPTCHASLEDSVPEHSSSTWLKP